MPVEIVPYTPDRKADFYKINAEWIEEKYVLEDADKRLLNDPEGQILATGGVILFAVDTETGEAIGTCSLVLHGGEWELGKMGVLMTARGRGAGRLLAESIIDAARAKGLSEIILYSNKKADVAIPMYERLGFKHIAVEGEDLARADVKMVLAL